MSENNAINHEFNDKVRLEDDLYSYVNGKWIENAVIPDDLPCTGGFIDLSVGVEKLMIEELNALSKQNKIDDELLNRAVNLYKKVLDNDSRKNGLNALLDKISLLDNIKDNASFRSYLYYLYDNNYTLPFSLGVSIDSKDATKYCLTLSSPSLILPDATMYGSDSGNALLGVYKSMIKAILDKVGIQDSDNLINKTIAFDERLSKIVKTNEEWADYIKAYNPYEVSEVCSLLDWNLKDFIHSRFGKTPEKIIVADPRFLDNYKELMEGHYEEFSAWSKVLSLYSNIGYISEEFRELSSIYSNALSGAKAVTNIDKYAYRLTDRFYSEVLGVYYGKKYFGEEAKKDVISIVHNLIESYKHRLLNNTWLSKATIKKAILKLDTMFIKIGYPEKVEESYKHLVFSEDKSLYEIVEELSKIKSQYYDSLLFKEVDHSLWVMSGNTVNACYNPSFNDITFPAAILQRPFYSLFQSVEENYGGIGCVIGHEISHAFDNNGAQMDEKGNINNWWTKEDYEHFQEKTELMVKEFDSLQLNGNKVNGKLTVSENIADNGGITSSLESLHRIKPDADLKLFFINYARIWCIKQRPEYEKLLLTVDVHGPAYYRANMQVRNFDEFYQAFDIKEDDKMFLPKEQRVIIW